MVLSFVIPAYNAERYLHQTLRSVLGQTGGRMEVILVDDGSTDTTHQIAEQYARHHSCIHLIRTENHGVSHARNVGVSAAKGLYVAFLDADDVLCADAYTPDVESFLATGEYDLISFGYIPSDHKLRYGNPVGEQNRFLCGKEPDFQRLASRKHFASRIYRRTMLHKVRFFEGIRYGEDLVFSYLAARQAESLACFDRYWFIYRNNIHSAIHSTKGWQYILTDCVPAWARAAEASGDEAGHWDCWGMVYSQMGLYLRYSAMAGVPLRQLQAAVDHCVPFQDVMNHPGAFWTKPDTVKFFSDLDRAPRRTWARHRLQGLVPQMAMQLSRTAPLRRVYFRLKYRTPLKPFLPPLL